MGIWIRPQAGAPGFYDIRNGEGGDVIEGVTAFTVNALEPGQPATVTLTVFLESFEVHQPEFRSVFRSPEGNDR